VIRDPAKFETRDKPMPRGWFIDPENDLQIRYKDANNGVIYVNNSLDLWTWILHYERESTRQQVSDPRWNDKLPEVARAGMHIRRIDDIENLDMIDTQHRPGHMTEGTDYTESNPYA
jgi:hypothetical protein